MKQSTVRNLAPSPVPNANEPPGPTGIDARRVQLVTDTVAPTGNSPSLIGASVSIWRPSISRDGRTITTDEVLRRARPPEQLPVELESAIIATLSRPLESGESHQTGNANREHELRELFSSLDTLQAHHLGRRLDLDRAGDQLAAAFRRLVVDRRQRLRAFLADARRRAMLAR